MWCGRAGASAGGQRHGAWRAQTAFSAAEAQAARTIALEVHKSVLLAFFHTDLRNFCWLLWWDGLFCSWQVKSEQLEVRTGQVSRRLWETYKHKDSNDPLNAERRKFNPDLQNQLILLRTTVPNNMWAKPRSPGSSSDTQLRRRQDDLWLEAESFDLRGQTPWGVLKGKMLKLTQSSCTKTIRKEIN